MAFRRKLALSPATQQPAWARPSEARALLPATLAGAWSDGKTTERDRQALSTLAQMPYETMVEALVRWSHEADPPVRRVGDAWYIVSKEDAWCLLGRCLTRSDLECLEQVVLEVLGTPDPAFDLPEEQRWMAGALGHSPAHSGLLRAGLADTLAMLGARGETIAVGMGMSARHYAMRIVRQLLQQANADWRLWASLSRFLPLLAEAAPDTFLAAVEEGLSGAQPILLNLFSENENPLFSSSPHTGLLWALQTLAWSPEHLGRVALLLAKLGSIDTKDAVTKRAQNTLCEIFLPWHPQTAATLEQRLRVLDTLRERQPAVARDLLVGLIPEAYSIATNTPKPRWRDWGSECSSQMSRPEYLEAIGEVVTRMLADVGTSGPRWRNLIEALASLPVEQYEAVVAALSRIDTAGVGASDRAEIWNVLRKLISHHRSFPDADWSLPTERIDRLDELYCRFEPQELSARYAWLFGQTPELPEGENEGWEAHHQAIADARLQAARAVYSYSGAGGLLELAGCVQLPFELGMTLGRSELLETEEDELLSEHLAAEDLANAQFAAGLATGRIISRGREWAEAKLATHGATWPPAQRAQLLACSPADPRTWSLAENSGSETEEWYWRLVYPFLIDRSGNIEHAVWKLIEYGRPFSAIEFLASAVKGEQRSLASLVADALEQALRTPARDDRPSNSLPHHVSKLLDVIESNLGDERRLAALEWGWLPLLRDRERPPKILHRELARNPEFFAELLQLIYRAEGEAPREATEEERARAQHASRLLDSWRRVPGATDDGEVDANLLKDWVRRARAAKAASGRGAVGDDLIGHVLSASPAGPDAMWPHPAVCDVIEDAASDDLESGFRVGLYNTRGGTWRDPSEGGNQERDLAARYEKFAVAASDRWPRTAAMLRRIAEQYRAEARREDQESELEQDLP
jgi:hypothetical protein